jgi:hypothetical protein
MKGEIRMRRIIMVAIGLLVGLAGAEARAACDEGTYGSCKMTNGCPGMKECVYPGWGPCEPVAGTKTCTVCSGSGSQQCDSGGEIVTSCARAEQCNSCDDDQDGQVDEGLPGCGGVTCGHIFEQCGDGLDNDCDGGTDEGCAVCTGAPTTFAFPFNSQDEIRLDTDQPGGGSVYGRLMDSRWRFIPSHRVNAFALRFDQFSMEPTFDAFFINGAIFDGSPALPFQTGMFAVGPGQPATFRFLTDHSVQTTGVRTTSVSATCHGGGGNSFATMELNQGADGVLLHQDDSAYVSFVLPAWREVFISLDHNFGPFNADFNMFVTWGSSSFGTSCDNSNRCGVSGSATGEVVHVPGESGSRLVKVNINANAGAGRFRLFLASPVASFSEVVELAFEGNVPLGSTLDQRGKQIWGHTQRLMMTATDGQYRIHPAAVMSREASCFSCYDAVYTEQNSVGSTPCALGVTTWSVFGKYIALPKPYWEGASSWTDDGVACTTSATAERVAETMVHEWGHYEFGHDDERDDTGNRCGFSLMAASWRANFTPPSGNQHFEFCTDSRHGMNPSPGSEAATGSSNWSDITDEHSEMLEPIGTGDFSRMRRLGEVMAQGSFISFTED